MAEWNPTFARIYTHICIYIYIYMCTLFNIPPVSSVIPSPKTPTPPRPNNNHNQYSTIRAIVTTEGLFIIRGVGVKLLGEGIEFMVWVCGLAFRGPPSRPSEVCGIPGPRLTLD